MLKREEFLDAFNSDQNSVFTETIGILNVISKQAQLIRSALKITSSGHSAWLTK